MFSEFLDTHDLRSFLVPRERRMTIPSAKNRAAWMGLTPELLAQVAAWAAEEATRPNPMLTATAFLAFVRTGSRSDYETPYFARRRKLMAAVLGLCTGNPNHLDAVVDGLWCICEESFWGVSAHNGSDHPGQRPAQDRALPNTENPYVDLFAAQTAALLSWSCYLLREELDAVSPLIRRRARKEVERRVIAPFFRHDDFWWMGMIRQDVNNWTPWIVSNVMAALMIWEEDDIRLCEGLARGLRMLDRYLAIMPEDGGCDEGAAYWNMAGAALLDCLEWLFEATEGRVSFYQEPLIRRIGEFPLHAHISGPYFWNFADCDAKPSLDGERVYQYGKRTQNEELAAFGAFLEGKRVGIVPGDTPEMSRVLHRLFSQVRFQEGKEPVPKDTTLPNLGVGVRVRRRLYAAMKAGHNGENHNHNDVGTLLLYVDGKPAIIDLGNMVYTAKTFSGERYTLPNTRSMNHNVPMIGSWEQVVGREHTARKVEWLKDGVSMDMAAAYPKEAGVVSLERIMRLEADAVLTIQDSIRLEQPQPVTWVFMLREKPALGPGLARSAHAVVHFDAGLNAGVEEYPVCDPRMARNFPGSLWRLCITAGAASTHEQSFAWGAAGE